MSLFRRIFCYCLAILPALGLFLDRLLDSKFNIDEYQHTHLAWMATHFGKFQYREIWDNHGPLYTIVNSLFVYFADLQANVATLMAERYLNLVILLLGFLVLFELFRAITGKWYLAIFGPWIFANSAFALHAIQVRPDNLQCLFLYLALLLLVKSLQQQKVHLAFSSGILLTLMLMTNLKSVSALVAILISLGLTIYLKKDTKIIQSLKSLLIGLVLGISCSALMLMMTGLLQGYIQDNILFSFFYLQIADPRPSLHAIDFYFNKELFLTFVLFALMMFWPTIRFNTKVQNDNSALVIWMIVIILWLTRFTLNMWSQYDLLFIPIICFMASCLVLNVLESVVLVRIQKNTTRVIAMLVFFVSWVILSWHHFCTDEHSLFRYRIALDKKIKITRQLIGELGIIDNFSRYEPELAFFQTASRQLIQTQIYMDAVESLYDRPVYGQEYIDLLEAKKVKLLLKEADSIDWFRSNKVKEYIREKYTTGGRFWLRRDGV